MTYTAHEPRPLYAAVSTRLASQTGRSVGQAVSPGGVMPYMVLYPWPDIDTEGGLSDPHEIARQRFQVTSVGDTMDNAQWMQHKVRDALLGWAPTVAGLTTTPIHLDEGSGVSRDDDLSEPAYFTTDRFWLFTSA